MTSVRLMSWSTLFACVFAATSLVSLAIDLLCLETRYPSYPVRALCLTRASHLSSCAGVLVTQTTWFLRQMRNILSQGSRQAWPAELAGFVECTHARAGLRFLHLQPLQLLPECWCCLLFAINKPGAVFTCRMTRL